MITYSKFTILDYSNDMRPVVTYSIWPVSGKLAFPINFLLSAEVGRPQKSLPLSFTQSFRPPNLIRHWSSLDTSHREEESTVKHENNGVVIWVLQDLLDHHYIKSSIVSYVVLQQSVGKDRML